MPDDFWFSSWERQGASHLAADPADPGRALGSLSIQLSDAAGPVPAVGAVFQVPGPRDVRGLQPTAVRGMLPLPGQPDGEASYCAYVELAAADLPWRYSPDGGGGRPWLVLVVGRPEQVTLLDGGGLVQLDGSLGQMLWDLSRSAFTAHVQHTVRPTPSGPPPAQDVVTARLVFPRDLDASTDYVAVVVSAFDDAGHPSWDAEDLTVGPLPVHHAWRFRTGENGSFKDLALALHHAEGRRLGRLQLRVAGAPSDMFVRGALADPDDVDDPPDDVASTQLAALLALRTVGPRRVVGPPRYGDAWAVDAGAVWSATVNLDPRHRAVAGVGLRAGVLLQEEISAAAAERAGGTFIAGQRIRALALGLEAARASWERRVPADPRGKVALFGPSSRRIMAAGAGGDDDGTLLDLVATGTSLPAALLSTAARRALRPGTPLRRHLADNATPFDTLVQDAANAPATSPRRPDERLDPGEATGEVHGDSLARELGLGGGDELIEQLLERLGDNDLRDDLVAEIGRGEPPRPETRAVDLDKLGDVLGQAFDPTGDGAVVIGRVISCFDGLEPPFLAPPEPCLPLDLPGWRILRDHAPTWLLPGAEQLQEGEVAALVTNQRFVEAFLLGINTQAIAELRWRGIPLQTGCTPLRRFWDRIAADGSAELTDMSGVSDLRWPAASDLGQHAPDPPPKARLVLAFRTELFRRYPSTIVRLASARHPDLFDNSPRFDLHADANAERIAPVVQAQVSRSLTLVGFDVGIEALDENWVLVEEVPRGLKFLPGLPGGAPPSTTPAAWAAKQLQPPVRVFISGPSLRPTA